ncbi:MAG: choice-of-anchor D domain-containing protein [Deltaproteobacteria bacterium]|nr:choice-of-anchor D domain-containing protein [Deltaproteobacteria bacterium]
MVRLRSLRSALVALLAVSACKCGQNGILYAGPHAVAPSVLDFGQVRVGARVQKTIAITNDGRQPLDITPTIDAQTAAAFRFAFTPGTKITIDAGGELDLPVEFQPTVEETDTGAVNLQTNVDGEERLVVQLKGQATKSALVVCVVDGSSAEHCDSQLTGTQDLLMDFGSANPHATVTRQVILRVTGDSPVQLVKVAPTATSATDFVIGSQLGALPKALAAGSETRFDVIFTPTVGGNESGQLELLSNSDGRPRELIDLAGAGIAPRLCISASDLDLGDISMGKVARKTATLTSCGLQDLQLNGLSVAGTVFGLENLPSLPKTLAPNATATVGFKFAPTTVGPQHATLSSQTNEPAPSTFLMRGNASSCTLDLVPTTMAYGTVSTNASSTKTLLLRSTGESACTVTALNGPTGSTAFAFASLPQLPIVIQVGVEYPVDIVYTPTGTGAQSATLEIDSDDTTLPVQHVSLNGTGSSPPPCDFVPNPHSLGFNSISVGQSQTQSVVVTNKGTGDCYVVGGGPTGDNSFTATLPTGFPPPTIASGASFTVPVKFSPTTSAVHTATLDIKYSDQPVTIGTSQVVSIPLTGGTQVPKMCLSPTALDWGSQAAGTQITKSFTITSCGAGQLTLRGLVLAAGTSREFVMVSPPGMPLVLPANASATVNVQYTPASTAGSAGRIDVLSNDPNLPTGSVSLRGNLSGSCAAQLVCSPSSVNFSGTEAGRTSAQPVACTNTGTTALTVSGVSASSGSGPDLSIITGHLPITLQPGGVLRADISFAPVSPGAQVATFTFATSGGCSASVDVSAIGNPANLPPCPHATTFTPATKWTWNGGSVSSDSSNLTMTPLVVRLADENHDGAIDEKDSPDVIFTSCSASTCCVGCSDPQHLDQADLSGTGILRAVSGKDGSALWNLTSAALQVPASSQIALGDLDGDGLPEIVAVKHTLLPAKGCPGAPDGTPAMCGKYASGTLLVLDRTGKLLFETEPWGQPDTVVENNSAPLIADLDQDGFPEIIFGDTVFDTNGHVKFKLSKTFANTGHGTFPAAADVDGDGKLEVLAGPTAYRSDGSVLWTTSGVNDGMDLVADTDGDGKPEVIVRGEAGRIDILDGATGSIKRTIQFPMGKDQGGVDTSACAAPMSAADVLGNGKMQLAVPAGNWFFLVRPDTGATLWQKPIEDYDGQCGASGAATFSFFGDGKSDVVYHDTQSIWVWRGDGTEVYKSPRTSSTLFETPVIADVDNDGHADILITNEGLLGTKNGLTALTDSAGSWPGTRRVWSQWNYHVTDVNENGTIPRVEHAFWQNPRLWRGNPALCTP